MRNSLGAKIMRSRQPYCDQHSTSLGLRLWKYVVAKLTVNRTAK